MQGSSQREPGRHRPKKLSFRLNEQDPPSRSNGMSKRSQSTPSLMENKLDPAAGKVHSRIRKLKDKWGSGGRLENSRSENNVSAVPHYDLEFPSDSELISVVQEIQGYSYDTPARRAAGSRCKGWKLFKRGTKYQVPPEFSLFWVVTDITPNLRFKMKLYFDPDRRQFCLNWDTQLGQITYFDGNKTVKTECKTAVSPDNIWSISIHKKLLKISCNYQVVVEWGITSSQNILAVQPIRFTGRYYITTVEGRPPRNTFSSNHALNQGSNHALHQGVSLVELDGGGSVTDSESTSDKHSRIGEYDDTTIKFSRSDGGNFYDSLPNLQQQSNPHQQLRGSQSSPSHADTNHPNNDHSHHGHQHSRSNNGSKEMVKVKQLSSDLVSLIVQLENDFKYSDNSFKQKIRALDDLSRSMVQTLKTIQRETRDSKAELKRREVEQMGYTVTLEERIARLEDTTPGFHSQQFTSLAGGFESMIQQYIDSESRTILPRLTYDTQIQEVEKDLKDKLKTLNKRIKTEQSGLLKELNHVRSTVAVFMEEAGSAVADLQTEVSECGEETRLLATRHIEDQRESFGKFVEVNEQLTAFDMKLNTLDAALEEVEQNHLIEEEFNAKHYSTVDDLTGAEGEAGIGKVRQNRNLPPIQEENRLENLERLCRDMKQTMETQSRQIETLQQENTAFRATIRQDLGLQGDTS